MRRLIMSCLILIYADGKNLLLSHVAAKELIQVRFFEHWAIYKVNSYGFAIPYLVNRPVPLLKESVNSI